MPFEITIQSRRILLQSKSFIKDSDYEKIETLIRTIDSVEELVKTYIFDLSQLSQISPECIPIFLEAQNHARRKQDAQIIVILPEDRHLTRQLIEQKIIKDEEICPNHKKLKSYIKEKQ